MFGDHAVPLKDFWHKYKCYCRTADRPDEEVECGKYVTPADHVVQAADRVNGLGTVTVDAFGEDRMIRGLRFRARRRPPFPATWQPDPHRLLRSCM